MASVKREGGFTRMIITMEFSAFLRRRRQTLRLSQADVAWLAKISRTTLSNLEHGRGEPESRTVVDVLTALGYSPLAVDDIEEGGLPDTPLVEDVFLQRIIGLISQERAFDPSSGRRFADRLMMFLQVLAGAEGFEGFNRRILIDFVTIVAPRLDLSSAIDVKILELLESHDISSGLKRSIDNGRMHGSMLAKPESEALKFRMSSDVDSALNEIRRKLDSIANSVQPYVKLHHDLIRAFERLPVVVQDVLLHGQVVEHATHRPQGAPELTVLDLVVRDSDKTSVVLANRRKTIEAVRRWSSAFLVAQYLMQNLEPERDPREIIDAVVEVLDTSSGARIQGDG
ncbi:helix-turn-helix transcriptional regulator [Sphaerisporangium sp. NPDC088356]|uniref:helix-turn-helix domain-containing protein n=1 Tax=Sphaerisporangium sp. NPDC088356 TaxID=3154871 RepID=UPI00343F59AC